MPEPLRRGLQPHLLRELGQLQVITGLVSELDVGGVLGLVRDDGYFLLEGRAGIRLAFGGGYGELCEQSRWQNVAINNGIRSKDLPRCFWESRLLYLK